MKDYRCICHVCGMLHTVKCDFMSCPSYRRHTDGREYPVYSCGNHTAKEVGNAYHGRKKIERVEPEAWEDADAAQSDDR